MKNITELKEHLEKIKKNSEIKQQINNPQDLLSKIDNEEWESLQSHHISKIDHSQVYVRYNHNEKKTNYITIYLGKHICELLEFKKDDKVGILSSLKSKGLFLIQKNPIGIQRYTICTASNTQNKHFKFPINFKLNFPISQSLPVEFDINQDFNLIINTTKIII